MFPRNGLCLKRMKDVRTAKGGRRGLASSKIIGYACGDTFEKVVGEDGETCLRHGFTSRDGINSSMSSPWCNVELGAVEHDDPRWLL